MPRPYLGKPDIDVYHYFRDRFGSWPADQQLKSVPISTPEGVRMRECIDAADTLIEHARHLFASTPEKMNQTVAVMIRAVDQICCEYVRRF